MNITPENLEDLLRDYKSDYKLTQEDLDWLNMKPVGREIIIDDLSDEQLEKLTFHRLKEAITKVDSTHQKLNKKTLK